MIWPIMGGPGVVPRRKIKKIGIKKVSFEQEKTATPPPSLKYWSPHIGPLLNFYGRVVWQQSRKKSKLAGMDTLATIVNDIIHVLNTVYSHVIEAGQIEIILIFKYTENSVCLHSVKQMWPIGLNILIQVIHNYLYFILQIKSQLTTSARLTA